MPRALAVEQAIWWLFRGRRISILLQDSCGTPDLILPDGGCWLLDEEIAVRFRSASAAAALSAIDTGKVNSPRVFGSLTVLGTLPIQNIQYHLVFVTRATKCDPQ